MDHVTELIIAYRRDVLSQMLLVGTVMGAFSASGLFGVAALPAGTPAAGRLRTYLFVLLTHASLLFIFATVLAALVLPAFGRILVTEDPTPLPQLHALSRLVIIGVAAGCLALVVAIGGLGFTVSRRLGVVSLSAAGVSVLGFIACCVYLAVVLG